MNTKSLSITKVKFLLSFYCPPTGTGPVSNLQHTSLFVDNPAIRLERGNFSVSPFSDEENTDPPCTDGSDLLKYLNSPEVRAGMSGPMRY